jgi:phage terminase large subunit-like protein
MSVKADYSCIVVIGIDSKGDIYVLDIARFKTNKMETYFQNILDLHTKWEFMKIRAEVSVAQEAIVQYIQDRAKDLGMSLKVDRFRPTRNLGSKEERIKAILEPRYENQEVWHYKGGYISMLEEELLQANPKHDDLKDCLASVVSMETVRPRSRRDNEGDNVLHLSTHKRFGGITY